MKKVIQIVTILTIVFLLSGVPGMAKDVKKIDIQVIGMTCNNCVTKVKTALAKVEGVQSVKVSLKENKATIKYDAEKVNEKALATVITTAGFSTEAKNEVKKECSSETQKSSTCCGHKCQSTKKDDTK